MTQIFNIAFALLIGLLMTRLFSKRHLPDVTAFLVAGVLIGPFILGRAGIPGLGFSTYDDVAGLSDISNVAMGFIAFSIGSEFRSEDLKKTGKKAFVVGIVQAVCACIFVDAVLLALHFIAPDVISIPAAITLGAIATATAPAATMMVIRQYKAEGPLTLFHCHQKCTTEHTVDLLDRCIRIPCDITEKGVNMTFFYIDNSNLSDWVVINGHYCRQISAISLFLDITFLKI